MCILIRHLREPVMWRSVFCWLILSVGASTAQAEWIDIITSSNPLNWYRLDEVAGTTAVDYGSQGLNGIYGIGIHAPVRGETGLVGGAIRFNGGAENVRLNGSALTGDWTAEFLLMRTGDKNSTVLLRNQTAVDPRTALKLEQFSGTHQVGFTQYGMGDYTFTPGYTAPLNEFIHLVYVKQASGISLFVDGVPVGTRANTIALSRFDIGSPDDVIPESPFAVLDEVVIYGRALPLSEIESHFNAIVAVPEPGSIWILTSGALWFALLYRRRR